jgi:hypothetical protein
MQEGKTGDRVRRGGCRTLEFNVGGLELLATAMLVLAVPVLFLMLYGWFVLVGPRLTRRQRPGLQHARQSVETGQRPRRHLPAVPQAVEFPHTHASRPQPTTFHDLAAVDEVMDPWRSLRQQRQASATPATRTVRKAATHHGQRLPNVVPRDTPAPSRHRTLPPPNW